ncbi:MAG: hypothetical protein LYZ70_06710 [Nitrososphaerales archaeon]|nr:hypothetical protein [Nitrososphaerales archaeon]
MNAPKTLAGAAVLVLAAFWAFLLFDLLSVIGYIIDLAAPFAVLLAIGAYMVLDGVGALSVKPRSARTGGQKLGALDLTVLQMTAQRKSQQDISSATGVSPSVIGEKLESLKEQGYLEENSLSEKGFDALRGTGAA